MRPYRLTTETISGDSSATPQDGTISYSYDAVGNRTQMTSTVPAIPAGLFQHANDQPQGSDTYDANGNTVSSGGISATYGLPRIGSSPRGADHRLQRGWHACRRPSPG